MELHSKAKRKKKDEVEGQASKTNKLEEEQPQPPVVQPNSPILKAPYDVLELLFDYISLRDLCSVGMTCKRLQQTAGTYFRLYYPQIPVQIYSVNGKVKERLYVQNTNFGCYAKRIHISNLSPDNEENALVRYIAQLKMKKWKYIYLPSFSGLSNDQAESLAETLENVETVEFYGECSRMNDILSLCSNLKTLKLFCISNFDDENDHSWPTRKHPKLEELHCTTFPEKNKINKLQCLKENPQIKRMRIGYDYENPVRHFLNFFEKTEVQLDELTFFCGAVYDDDMIRLNRLQERGYFKHVHVNFSASHRVNLSNLIDYLNEHLNNMDSLAIKCTPFPRDVDKSITEMPNVKKLKLSHWNVRDKNKKLSKLLMNLDELSLHDCSISTIQSLVRNLPKLQKLRIYIDKAYRGLNAHQLNEERKKLPEPRRKLTIYLDGFAFLRARWASINLNYELIEIRRVTEDYFLL